MDGNIPALSLAKPNAICVVGSLVSVALLAVTAACAAPRVDFVESGRLRVDTDALGDFRPTVRAFDEDGRLVVQGALHRDVDRRRAVGGRLSATLIGPDGTVIASAESDIRSVRHGRWGHLHGAFRLVFAQVPPDGATVRLDHLDDGGRR